MPMTEMEPLLAKAEIRMRQDGTLPPAQVWLLVATKVRQPALDYKLRASRRRNGLPMTDWLAHLPAAIANNADSLEANLDAVKYELNDATDDFQRMQIRQGAQALAAAAAIMQRTDI